MAKTSVASCVVCRTPRKLLILTNRKVCLTCGAVHNLTGALLGHLEEGTPTRDHEASESIATTEK